MKKKAEKHLSEKNNNIITYDNKYTYDLSLNTKNEFSFCKVAHYSAIKPIHGRWN